MDVIEEFDQKVYKKDSSGKIRVLHVYTEGADLIQESGVVDGALVEHRSTCVGKNIGRSNETTPEEQAKLEAASKIETKRSTGYFDTVEEAEDEEVILPMLAKDYKKESKKIVFPCYVQPKLDGMRALGIPNDIMISRKGKEIETMAHIQTDIDNLLVVNHLDGELYAHGLSFQENMKIIKKYRQGETEKVKYHVYDMVLPDVSFADRYKILSKVIDCLDNIELVPTYKVNSEQEIKEFHSKFLNEGYEGTIIRHSDAGYAVNKRDSQLLKYKDFIDETYTVCDILPSERNPDQGVVHCVTNDGTKRTFGCGMKFSHDERKAMLNNVRDYVGKTAEIRFFEYTDDGLPRFPVCVGFRLDK